MKYKAVVNRTIQTIQINTILTINTLFRSMRSICENRVDPVDLNLVIQQSKTNKTSFNFSPNNDK